MILTEERWKELNNVNRKVNSQTTYRTDMELYDKPEFWTILEGRSKGDCEDYALTKRQQLIELGWDPVKDLSLVICYVPSVKGYHAVLMAKTDKGNYILDNNDESVKPWKKVTYVEWKQIQIGTKWYKYGG